MSSINYALLGGDASESTPADGIYAAYLMAARLQTSNNGDFLVTEWQAGSYWWETLFGFTSRRMAITQEFLDGLGVDRSHITDDDAFRLAIAKASGKVYNVRVEVNGNFVNTYIETPGAQESGRGQEALAGLASSRSFDSDIPPSDSDLPDPGAAAAEPVTAHVPDDDDIPF
jgi:hypothetical protein